MQETKGMDFAVLVLYCEQMEFEFFGQRLKAIREGRFIRQDHMGLRELARRSGVKASTLSQWESGLRWRDKQPPGDDLRRLATGLDIPLEQLVGTQEEAAALRDEPLPEIQTAPLSVLLERIGAWPYQGRAIEGVKASAGTGSGSTLPQGFDDARPVGGRRGRGPDPIQNVEITGDCMVDLLYPGDVVVVDTRQMPEIGDVVVAVRFHDEMIVKYLRANGEHQYLESKDGKTLIPLDQYIRVLGPAVLFQRRLR